MGVRGGSPFSPVPSIPGGAEQNVKKGPGDEGSSARSVGVISRAPVSSFHLHDLTHSGAPAGVRSPGLIHAR